MKDLGMKSGDMYPSMAENDKEKVHYTQISLPLSIVDGEEPEIGDEITVTIKGKVKQIMKMDMCENISIEAQSGKVVEKGDSKKEDKTETLLSKS